VIRMAQEEDVMSLLVNQYKEGGTKLLQDHLRQRHDQQIRMEEEIGRKKDELLNIYAEAKDFMQDTHIRAEQDQIAHFEKDWKQKNDNIQAVIDKVRRAV
jgi:hypothetical protein